MREKLMFVILLALLFLPQSAGLALAQDPGVPDTCRVSCSDITLPGQQVVIEVSIYNDEALGGLVVPLVFGQPTLDVVCDSVSFVGSRLEGVENLEAFIDNANYKLLFYAIYISADLPAGDGMIATLYFTTGPNWDSTLCVHIDSTFYPPANRLEFSPRASGKALYPKLKRGCLGSGLSFTPTLISPVNQAFICATRIFNFIWSKTGAGVTYTLQYAQDSTFTTGVVTKGGLVDTTYSVSLPRQNCFWRVMTSNQCGKESPYQDTPFNFYVYKMGDVTKDGEVTASDVVYIINYLYRDGSEPIPLESGDMVPDSLIDASDLIYLVNYLYRGESAPNCP